MFRKAVESLYKDKFSVFEYEKVKDEITKQTELKEVEVLSDMPCRLVYKSIAPTTLMEGANSISQSTEIICSPDIEIKDSSKIVVTKATGQRIEYKRSGEPSYYSTHQQIMLELFKGWS